MTEEIVNQVIVDTPEKLEQLIERVKDAQKVFATFSEEKVNNF